MNNNFNIYPNNMLMQFLLQKNTDLISNINPLFMNANPVGPIKERFKDSYKDIDNLVDFSDVEEGNIYVNLIHFDENIKNEENNEYYRYFSIKLIGSYYTFDNYNMLKLFLSRLKEIPFSPCYILLITGKHSEKILSEFHDFDFINHIIIFCMKIEKYIHLKEKYKKIQIITNKFKEIIQFLKTIKLPKYDLNMDNHLLLTPLITYHIYKRGLFPIHRILAFFFQGMFLGFSKESFEISKKFVENSTFTTEDKTKIIKIMEKLIDCDNFPEKCIKYYTGENLCYIFNKALRNFEKLYVEMCHFIGPFYYGLYLYALNHENQQINKKVTLFRDIEIDRLDLYSYQLHENDIICFPSFTSTTLDENLNFEQSQNANKINNDNIDEKSFLKMIITYDPKGKCIPQCLDISKQSQFQSEKEILLFPFTFLKIDKVEIHSGKKDDKHLIYMTIINKGDVLEEGLNKRLAFKLVENGTKIIIDKENNSKCYNNEEYYKMTFDYINEEELKDKENKFNNNSDYIDNNQKNINEPNPLINNSNNNMSNNNTLNNNIFFNNMFNNNMLNNNINNNTNQMSNNMFNNPNNMINNNMNQQFSNNFLNNAMMPGLMNPMMMNAFNNQGMYQMQQNMFQQIPKQQLENQQQNRIKVCNEILDSMEKKAQNPNIKNPNNEEDNIKLNFQLIDEKKLNKIESETIMYMKKTEKMNEIFEKYLTKLQSKKEDNLIKKLIYKDNEISTTSTQTVEELNIKNDSKIKAIKNK